MKRYEADWALAGTRDKDDTEGRIRGQSQATSDGRRKVSGHKISPFVAKKKIDISTSYGDAYSHRDIVKLHHLQQQC